MECVSNPLEDTPMNKEELKKISDEVMEIIHKSKATFFVVSKDAGDLLMDAKTSEVLYELKAEISNNVGMYFYEAIQESKNSMQTEENKECCEKCYTNHTEHTWPAHTVYDACLNQTCICHRPCKNECHFQEPYGFVPEADCEIHDPKITQTELWEERFDKEFGRFYMSETGGEIEKEGLQVVGSNDIKSFIRSLLNQERMELAGKLEGMIHTDLDTIKLDDARKNEILREVLKLLK